MTVHAAKPGNMQTYCGQLIRKGMRTIRLSAPCRESIPTWMTWIVIDDPDLGSVNCSKCLESPDVMASMAERALLG